MTVAATQNNQRIKDAGRDLAAIKKLQAGPELESNQFKTKAGQFLTKHQTQAAGDMLSDAFRGNKGKADDEYGAAVGKLGAMYKKVGNDGKAISGDQQKAMLTQAAQVTRASVDSYAERMNKPDPGYFKPDSTNTAGIPGRTDVPTPNVTAPRTGLTDAQAKSMTYAGAPTAGQILEGKPIGMGHKDVNGNETVKQVQEFLVRDKRYANNADKSEVDGYFGPKTQSALKSWQGANGLKVDGTVDKDDLAKMGLGPKDGVHNHNHDHAGHSHAAHTHTHAGHNHTHGAHKHSHGAHKHNHGTHNHTHGAGCGCGGCKGGAQKVGSRTDNGVRQTSTPFGVDRPSVRTTPDLDIKRRANNINESMRGIDTDHAAMARNLADLSNADMKKLRELYPAISGGDSLKAAINKDFNIVTDMNPANGMRAMNALIDGNRNGPKNYTQDRAFNDARALNQALRSDWYNPTTWGTDEDKLTDVLTNRSPSQLRAIAQEYGRGPYGGGLRAHIKSETREDPMHQAVLLGILNNAGIR